MAGETVEKKLYDAALKGDVTTSLQLLQQDPYLVEKVSFSCSRNLLHVATMGGQAGIVAVVLKINPQLARILDSQKSSPLHIVAAQGNVEIASKLLSVAPEMCWWRDDQGMNPVHVAAMKGHVEMVKELIRHDSSPAMERLHRGQTVLHLCAKHRQLTVLKLLVEKLGKLVVLAKDKDGNTVLDSAVTSNQLEMIKYLVEETEIDKRTMNSMKRRALDILKQIPSDTTTSSEIKRILTVRAILRRKSSQEMRDMSKALIVVAVLIATMAFQAAVSPPRGVWQDDTSSHRAGDSVMASTHPKAYRVFLVADTAALVLSLITIFSLSTGWPSDIFFLGTLVFFAVSISLVSILVSYGASLIVTTPNTEKQLLHLVAVIITFPIFFIVFSLALLIVIMTMRLYKIRELIFFD